MNRTRRLAPVVLGATVLLALLLGCSSGGDAAGGDAGSDSAAMDAPAPAVAAEQDAAVGQDGVAAKPAREETSLQQQAVIRKGSIAITAGDVDAARREVQQVVDAHAGQVTEQKAEAGEDGETAYVRMVLRVPTADFDDAVADLDAAGAEVGTVESKNTNEVDVTDQVIDVQTRLQVQRRSIARVTVLFDRATSIRDIMAIESELSQRQAELESLEKQAAHLEDQTSLSTITVAIDRSAAPHAEEKDDDESGFVAGLSAGWDALASFAVALATVAGALLPWTVVVAVVGVPTLLLVRAVRRRRTPGQSSG